MITRYGKHLLVSLISLLPLTGCEEKKTPSTISEKTSFYDTNNYRLVDPDSTLNEVILIVYSHFCSHCQVAEPLLEAVLKEEKYQNYNLVTVEPEYIVQPYYVVGSTFEEAMTFYLNQDSAKVQYDARTVNSFTTYPTPSLIYLKASRQISSIKIGVGSTIKAVQQSLDLLLS